MQRTSPASRTSPAAHPESAAWQQRPTPLPGTRRMGALHGPSASRVREGSVALQRLKAKQAACALLLLGLALRSPHGTGC